MTHFDAVLFDLDDTLLDTGSLRSFRDDRNWGALYANVGSASVFPSSTGGPAVETLPAQVQARGKATAVITNSPAPYARALLEKFEIKVDFMITGSDNYAAKPSPEGLLAAASELSIEPERCLYVGDAVGDFGAAASAGMVSAGVAWDGQFPEDWRRRWPDVAVGSTRRLLAVVDGHDDLAPLGEVVCAGSYPDFHRGSLLRLGDEQFGLGRYFPTADGRHPYHELSRLVIEAKNDPDAAEKVAVIFGVFAETATYIAPDLVVSVPPKPDQEYDRFAPARATMAAIWSAEDGEGVLEMRVAVDGYKAMDWDERAQANEGRFVCGEFDAEKVVVIDDVLTSGGQIEACRAALLDAGASSVSIVTLGIAQEPTVFRPCPRCGRSMRIRVNSYTGIHFLGCTGYFSGQCSETVSLPPEYQ